MAQHSEIKTHLKSCSTPGLNVSLGCMCIGRSRLDRLGFLGPIRVVDQGRGTSKVGEGYRGDG